MQDADMTGFNRSYKNIKWLTIFLMVVAVAGAGICCPTLGSAEPAGIKTIVIDPGHGGYDHGARGPAGSLEKSVIFQLAQILAAALAPDCQVVWTRTGDYQVALTRRASVANHHKADLFISLHAGGSPMPGGNAWSVFYFSDPNRNAALVPEPKSSGKCSDRKRSWRCRALGAHGCPPSTGEPYFGGMCQITACRISGYRGNHGLSSSFAGAGRP